MEEFQKTYRDLVSDSLEKENYRERQSWWTESIAFGGESFVQEVKEKLGAKAMWREIVGANGSYELRDPIASYEAEFACKNDSLRQGNLFFWDISL